ncbi:MAG: helicase RepA family protein [Candidatus Eremiobacteraeota bacterium]|nr:helicase RepA family protein [Candidatus Eremiobacteraeota bacterium]
MTRRSPLKPWPNEHPIGAVVDLHAAYTQDPPPRNDVLLGAEPGELTMLIGLGGVMKSQMLLGNIAHDLATGGMLRTSLLPDDIGPQRVLYVTAEESVIELGRRLHRIGTHLPPGAREICAQNLVVQSIKGKRMPLITAHGEVDPAIYDQIARAGDGANCIIIEPLNRFCKADGNADATMSTFVEVCESIGIQCQALVVSAHHSGKTAEWNGHSASALAAKGSTALIDGARLNMVLARVAEKVLRWRKLTNYYRTLTIAKANNRKEGTLWFRVRDDGTLEYDEFETFREDLEQDDREQRNANGKRRSKSVSIADVDRNGRHVCGLKDA